MVLKTCSLSGVASALGSKMNFFFVLLALFGSSNLHAEQCTENKEVADDFFFGEFRRVAYDLLEIPTIKKKVEESYLKVRGKRSETDLPQWEFTDGVHRVLTTMLIKEKMLEVPTKEHARLLDAALLKAAEVYAQ